MQQRKHAYVFSGIWNCSVIILDLVQVKLFKRFLVHSNIWWTRELTQTSHSSRIFLYLKFKTSEKPNNVKMVETDLHETGNTETEPTAELKQRKLVNNKTNTIKYQANGLPASNVRGIFLIIILVHIFAIFSMRLYLSLEISA